MNTPNSTPKKASSNTPKKRKQGMTENTPKKRKREVIENVLKHFKIITGEDLAKYPNKTHICNFCNEPYCGSKESNLSKHLQRCEPSVYEEITGEKDSPALKRLKFIQNCTEIIAVNGRPFSYLMDSGFQAMVKDIVHELKAAGCGENLSNPNLVVKEHLHETANQIQDKIRMETKNRPLSLLVDIGTSQGRSICGFSVQYTLNGQLKIRSIGMIELLKSHSAKNIAEVIINRLNELGINLSQIITITTDNGSNVLKMVDDINSVLQHEMKNIEPEASDQMSRNENEFENEQAIDASIEELLCVEDISDDDAIEQLCNEVHLDENNATLLKQMTAELTSITHEIMDITGVNCAAHTLQLGIKDALAKFQPNFKNVIELCRRVCKFLRLKSTSYASPIEYPKPRKENKTRWCSMYLMVC